MDHVCKRNLRTSRALAPFRCAACDREAQIAARWEIATDAAALASVVVLLSLLAVLFK